MPYINVNDAYILDNTGKQVDDAVDYALANSNRNLLDNPWFTYPINQREFTSGNTVGYTVDRWKNTTSGANVALTTGYNGYISIPANCVFAQYFESTKYASLVGRTVTLSAMLSDGTVTSGTVTVPFSGSQYASGASVRMAMDGTNGRFIVYPSSAVQIRALKVELGSYSTLANDMPPDYGEEFRKCARYFFRAKGDPLAVGYVSADKAYAYVLVSTPAPMRTAPSVATNGTFRVRGQGYTQTVTAISSVSSPANTGSAVGLRMTLTSSASEIGACGAYGDSGAYIDLSADL